MKGLGSPVGLEFSDIVGRQTEANEFVVLNVLRNLIVDLSSLEIVICVLNKVSPECFNTNSS